MYVVFTAYISILQRTSHRSSACKLARLQGQRQGVYLAKQGRSHSAADVILRVTMRHFDTAGVQSVFVFVDPYCSQDEFWSRG